MVRDGMSLTFSAALTSGIGMLGWVIAARLLPRAEVGTASAFVSGMLLVAGLADLGLGAALLRWVPRSGPLRGRLMLRSYCAVVVGAVLAAVAVLMVPSGEEILDAVPRLAVPAFLLAAVAWALFQFQDNVIVSLSRAHWVPIENLSMGAVRIAALVLLAPALGVLGILFSWAVPAVASVAVMSVFIHRALSREADKFPAGKPAALPSKRELYRFLAPTYPSKVSANLLSDFIPILVIGHFGEAAGAIFFVVWMAGNAVEYAASSFGHSLIVRISSEPDRTAALFVAGLRRLGSIFVPGLLLGALIAHPVLSIFGSDYAAQGTLLLRLILIGCIPRLLTTTVIALGLAHGRGIAVAVLRTIPVVGMVLVVQFAGEMNLDLMGYGFCVVETVVALLALLWLLHAFRGRRSPLAALRRLARKPAGAAHPVATTAPGSSGLGNHVDRLAGGER